MAPPTTRGNRNNSTEDGSINLTVDQKLDLLLNDVADIKRSNNQFKEDFSQIKEQFKIFKEEINSSIDMCFNTLSDHKVIIDQNKVIMQGQEKVVENLTSENIKLKKDLDKLQSEVHAANQYSRSNCLEIRGVPEQKNEVIIDIVKRVAKVIHFDLKDEMIDAVHRLSRNPDMPQAPRGIIIKFCRRLDLEEMRRKSRVKNGFSATELGLQSDSKVFISLSMTRETAALWKHTRDFKHEKAYKYVWITSTGKIFVRKEEGTRAISINSKKDLDQLK